MSNNGSMKLNYEFHTDKIHDFLKKKCINELHEYMRLRYQFLGETLISLYVIFIVR